MAYPVIEIEAVLRRVRGGSQGALIAGSDGRCYVAKFAENPQGSRTLVNECIAHYFLRSVGILTPDLRILHLSGRVRKKAELCFSVGENSIPVAPGLHLGSVCPVDPARTAIFDVMPRRLLHHVTNLEDFGKVWVLDKLLGQIDQRQCVFVREKEAKQSLSLCSYMIDQGLLFGGAQWCFQDSPLHGRFVDLDVYGMIDLRSVCREATASIRSIPEAGLYAAAADVPRAWFKEDDERDLAGLLATLGRRISRIESIIGWQLDYLFPDRSRAAQFIQPPGFEVCGRNCGGRQALSEI